MKVIGLSGGMSWESSAEYYRIINRAVRESLGGRRSAKCLMYSVDFHDIERWRRAGEWDEAARELPSFDTTRIHAEKAVELALRT
jgi:aspartate racemase